MKASYLFVVLANVWAIIFVVTHDIVAIFIAAWWFVWAARLAATGEKL